MVWNNCRSWGLRPCNVSRSAVRWKNVLGYEPSRRNRTGHRWTVQAPHVEQRNFLRHLGHHHRTDIFQSPTLALIKNSLSGVFYKGNYIRSGAEMARRSSPFFITCCTLCAMARRCCDCSTCSLSIILLLA